MLSVYFSVIFYHVAATDFLVILLSPYIAHGQAFFVLFCCFLLKCLFSISNVRLDSSVVTVIEISMETGFFRKAELKLRFLGLSTDDFET